MKTRRTTLGFFNPSQVGKAHALAKKYKKQGLKVVVEKNRRWGTIDVLKINKPTKKRNQGFMGIPIGKTLPRGW
jgi:hypothetical protein